MPGRDHEEVTSNPHPKCLPRKQTKYHPQEMTKRKKKIFTTKASSKEKRIYRNDHEFGESERKLLNIQLVDIITGLEVWVFHKGGSR